MTSPRQAEHAIEPLFLNRWSPRAFDASEMSKADLLCMLEAARWAPSAYNLQPWRFVYALRDDAHWPTFVEILNDFNRPWAKEASALVGVVSQTVFKSQDDGREQPLPSHSFDTGAAWAHMALQATALGYHAHAMAGIDFDLAHEALGIPDPYDLHILVAIGKSGDPRQLPDELQKREQPSARQALSDIAYPGVFPS